MRKLIGRNITDGDHLYGGQLEPSIKFEEQRRDTARIKPAAKSMKSMRNLNRAPLEPVFIEVKQDSACQNEQGDEHGRLLSHG